MTKDERLKPVFTEIYKIFVDKDISLETTHELLEEIIEFTKILSLTLDDDDDDHGPVVLGGHLDDS